MKCDVLIAMCGVWCTNLKVMYCLPAWKAAGLEVDQSSAPGDAVTNAAAAAQAPPPSPHYRARLDRSLVRSMDQMRANVVSHAEQVRQAGRLGRQ